MEPLFTTTTTYSLDEYKRYTKVIRQKVMHQNLRISVLFVLLLLLAFSTSNISIRLGIIAGIIFTPFIIKLVSDRADKKAYESNKAVQNVSSNFSFYPDHIEQHNELGDTFLPYNKLHRIVETKTNFYLMLAKNQGFVIIKENCSPELQQFIKGLMKK